MRKVRRAFTAHYYYCLKSFFILSISQHIVFQAVSRHKQLLILSSSLNGVLVKVSAELSKLLIVQLDEIVCDRGNALVNASLSKRIRAD